MTSEPSGPGLGRWRFICLLCIGLGSLSGCAAGTSPAPAQMTFGDRVCTTERTMGSHMPRRVCRSREQMEAEREAASSALNQIRNASPASTQSQ